ncbi:MAG TPA: hypothetical protein PK869_16080, partial [Candidatus Hydrogenedentes bacterium]|nr:hypothetical protein [Candidatus Hydrogenedentota bacterium]
MPTGTPLTGTLFWMVVICVALLAVAVVFEFVRQRRVSRSRVRGLWGTVEDIAREKELTDDEHKVLSELLRRWSPEEPHRAATVHEYFDECVEAEMNGVRARGDIKEFERLGVVLRDVRSCRYTRLNEPLAPRLVANERKTTKRPFAEIAPHVVCPSTQKT